LRGVFLNKIVLFA